MLMIQRLTREQIAKYKDKSQMAINGLNLALNQCEQIANLRDINQKWKYIAECMGLTQERGNSYYNTFIASKKDIMFLIRNANHNNTNEDLYNMHEQLGRPNKRYNIIFKHNSVFSDTSSTFLEAEHHVIFYQANSLDTSEDVKLYIQSLINLFENGETIFPKLPSANRSEINQNVQNNQTNENIIMKTNKIRLTESQLLKVINESVKRVLNEGVNTANEIREAQDILRNIINSGYIPFTSPSPSSTENEIKESIIEAMRLLDKACYLDMKCYGSEPVANVEY